MTKKELDFIGSMNMCDEISNEAYKKIVNHVEETEISDDCVSREKVWYMITGGKYPNEDYEQFIERLVKELENMPPVTPTFPEGATNGDMIKAMFPNVNFGTLAQDDVIVNKDYSNNGESQVFIPIRVWNAPYKRGSENG